MFSLSRRYPSASSFLLHLSSSSPPRPGQHHCLLENPALMPQLLKDLYCVAPDPLVHISVLIMLPWVQVVTVGDVTGHCWLGHLSEQHST